MNIFNHSITKLVPQAAQIRISRYKAKVAVLSDGRFIIESHRSDRHQIGLGKIFEVELRLEVRQTNIG